MGEGQEIRSQIMGGRVELALIPDALKSSRTLWGWGVSLSSLPLVRTLVAVRSYWRGKKQREGNHEGAIPEVWVF